MLFIKWFNQIFSESVYTFYLFVYHIFKSFLLVVNLFYKLINIFSFKLPAYNVPVIDSSQTSEETYDEGEKPSNIDRM